MVVKMELLGLFSTNSRVEEAVGKHGCWFMIVDMQVNYFSGAT